MAPLIYIATGRKIKKVIRMDICDEVIFDLVKLVFLVFDLIFALVDFGFDIEELIASFSYSAFPAMALQIG
jgi:hypothetical protein